MEDHCWMGAEFENYWLAYAIFIFLLLYGRCQYDLLKDPALNSKMFSAVFFLGL